MNCPHCGKPLSIVKAGATAPAGYTVNRRQVFHAAAPWGQSSAPAYEGYDYEKRQPAREPNLQADVAVPAAQSFLTGLALGVPGAAMMGLLGYESADAVLTGTAIGLAATTVTWLVKLNAHSKLLWLVEKITGHDLDGDNTVGEPAEAEPPIRIPPVPVESVQEQAPGRFTGININLPEGVDRGVFFAWAAAVANGQSAARDNWVGKGNPFGRKQYDDLLAAMEQIGIIADYGDGKGRVLTVGGKHRLTRMLAQTG